MPTILKEFPPINDANATEILLYFLSANSIGPEFALISTNPLIVAGIRYTPCEIIAPFARHGGSVDTCIDHELSRFYKNIDDEQKGSFWRGVATVLKGVDSLSVSGELGKYGLGELLESLFVTHYIPSEKSGGASLALKAMIESKKYINQPLSLWSQGHKRPTTLDVHWYAVRAYTQLQHKESPYFWKDLIEGEILLPNVEGAQLLTFRGLTTCNFSIAQDYLATLQGKTQDFYHRAHALLEIIDERNQKQ